MNNTARNCLQATIKKIEGAYAPATIRAYKSNFKFFINFCDENNETAFPTKPETVVRYIKNISSGRLKSSSIKIAVASISAIHRFNSQIDPAQHTDVKIEMRRMYRTLGRFTKQAYGINKDLLQKMIDSTDNLLRGVRDRALLYIAYDTMCRRSELTSMQVEDLFVTKNSIKINLKKSKTDQEHIGQWLHINKNSFKSIKSWISQSKITEGKLFRGIKSNKMLNAKLTDGQINRIYKKYAKLTHQNHKLISGHSLRVGASQDLLKSGTSLALIMHKGRWTKIDTVMSYTKNLDLAQD